MPVRIHGTTEITMNMHRRHTKIIKLSIMLVIPLIGLAGCAPESGNKAPPESLKPAGWLNSERSLEGERFADYADDVRQRLVEHRIPLDPARAALEVDRAAPVQLDPIASCNGTTHGIAILAHELSDTAFAMRDLVRYFASQCYIARTVLLPVHGTRAGDLLAVDHEDWTDACTRHSTLASMNSKPR